MPEAVLLLLVSVLAGLFAGQMRLAAIDGRALAPPAARSAAAAGWAPSLRGFVEAEPTRGRGVIRFRFATAGGRLMVEAPDPGADRLPGIGDELLVSGPAGPGPAWYRPILRRHGLRLLLRARGITAGSGRRSGITGAVDRIRHRAVAGLDAGMPAPEAALARGFVLGQDAAIDGRTTRDFRASGLSHLLAVSGQNVVLLGLLGWPLLAAVGLGLQGRRIGTALLILLYVPLAGGGASIQRAGAMGIAGLAVAEAGRAGSRIWILALAAGLTLGLDPRAGSDPGWQLSFAAVIGIALLASRLRVRLEPVAGSQGWRRFLAEGVAVTVAASLATAPLIAFHFGRLPAGTVAANLAVMPAVAPAMWLGMISAALGQLWPVLAVPFNLVNALVLAMIAAVAHWFGTMPGAQIGLKLGAVGLWAAVAGIIAGCVLLLRLWPVPAAPAGRPGGLRRIAAVGAAVLLLLGPVFGPDLLGGGRRQLDGPPDGGARIELLDVGQGDAILIRPSGFPPVLIDGGPPGGDLEGALRAAGVRQLAAVLLTHPDLDHYGGLFDLFPGTPVARFLFDEAPGSLVAAARAGGARTLRVGQGESLSPGAGLRLDLLWPPPGPVSPAGRADPNARSIGLLLSWKGFRMYLPGDGEAESVPVDPGPIDVLKVAHHGSADTGLPALLARDRPRLAVIEVGRGNRYGHPAVETLNALDRAGVRTLRTDRDGTVSILLDRSGYRIETGH